LNDSVSIQTAEIALAVKIIDCIV